MFNTIRLVYLLNNGEMPEKIKKNPGIADGSNENPTVTR
jgi:hypothetical protein